jgi:hypothetical protein
MYQDLLTKNIRQVLKYAKKNKVLYFCPQEEEIETPDQMNARDRQGFVFTDVNGFYTPSLFDYFWENIKCIYQFTRDFGLKYAFSGTSFTPSWSGWVWVVSSLDEWSEDIVVDRFGKYPKNYNEEVAKITEQDRIDFMNDPENGYISINWYMWVNKVDPTVIVYDPKNKPYDMRDGWSTEQIGEILSDWASVIGNIEVPAKYK